MVILGIETSCDETAAAIVKGPNKKGRVHILSNIVASSQSMMAKYGGVIPEQAAREQLKSIIPVIAEALSQAFPNYTPNTKYYIPPIDAIAVTYGPGLIGSLLVGVETAKTLSIIWNKPLIPINHLLAHFYANWVNGTPNYPCIGLLVSGGHTNLILFTDHNRYKYLGGTRDDAAGECFDKSARLLCLPYPGGPALAKLATFGNPKAFKLPRPMINSQNLDFSFSGLKTAIADLVSKLHIHNLSETLILRNADTLISDLCASIQQAIIDVLVQKTITAAQRCNVKHIMLSGGVAANVKLAESLTMKFHGRVSIPPPQLCTDNAAMVATCALFNFNPQDPLMLNADPNLFW